MEKTKGLHLYDYLILIIVFFLMSTIILGALLYKSNKRLSNAKSNIENTINVSNNNEKFLNDVINSHFNTIIKIKGKNDSLVKVNKDIDKRRKINYKLYLNEIKVIDSIDSVDIIMDSILFSNHLK